MSVGIPLHLHELKMGFDNLVNKYGCELWAENTLLHHHHHHQSPRKKLNNFRCYEKFRRDGTRT